LEDLRQNGIISDKSVTETDMAQLEMKSDEIYDLIIVGGGPAALNASLYALRKGLKTAMICRDLGGHVKDTVNIENYLGYMKIDGYDLIEKFKEQMLQFDCYIKQYAVVVGLKDGEYKSIMTDDGQTFRSAAVILATGSDHRILDVPGERELFGAGLSYCAICDGPLFRGKDVIIAGGGNSAVGSAIDLSKICGKISIIHRSEFRADRILQDRLSSCKNIEIFLRHKILEVLGKDRVEGVKVLDKDSNEEKVISSDALFIEIGLVPNSGYARDVVDINESGEIIIDRTCSTSVPGIFAAGDVTTSPFKQIVIASSEGAIAALSANEYLNRSKTKR
jgi:NADH-dependent peroxiredoxin subunit F